MLGGDQTITISARASMRADAADVFRFLAAPCNHRRLQVPGIRVYRSTAVRMAPSEAARSRLMAPAA